MNSWTVNRIPIPIFLKWISRVVRSGALDGARKTIERACPFLLVATHGDREHAFVLDYLEQYDYVHEVLNPDALKGDTEIVAFPEKTGA